jgi:hypothetical protein
MWRARLVPLVALIVGLSACAAPRSMKPTTTELQPTAEKAVVRFLYPYGNIWDGETFLGHGEEFARFDYHASPGRHIFFATMWNKAFLEADLDAGKTYYIVGRLWTGPFQIRVELLAVNRGGKYWDRVTEMEQSTKRYAPDPAAVAAYEAKHKERMRALLAEYERTWKHEYAWPRLNREDGR